MSASVGSNIAEPQSHPGKIFFDDRLFPAATFDLIRINVPWYRRSGGWARGDQIRPNLKLTVGTISGFKDGVRIAHNDEGSREWHIVGRRNRAFVEAGDSGSFVINRDLKVVGVVTSTSANELNSGPGEDPEEALEVQQAQSNILRSHSSNLQRVHKGRITKRKPPTKKHQLPKPEAKDYSFTHPVPENFERFTEPQQQDTEIHTQEQEQRGKLGAEMASPILQRRPGETAYIDDDQSGRTSTASGKSQKEIWDVVTSNCEAAKIWNEKLDEATRYLRDEAIDWTFLHLGTIDYKVAVIIGHRDKVEIDRRFRITGGLHSMFFPPKVFDTIRFINSSVERNGGSDSTDGGTVYCGTSIGVEGICWTAGTVGEFLAADNSSEIYGLTCHHVVLPTKRNEKTGAREEGIDQGAEAEGGAMSGSSGAGLAEGEPDIPAYPTFLDEEDVFHDAVRINDGPATIRITQPPCRDHFNNIRRGIETRRRFKEGLGNLMEMHKLLGTEPPSAAIERWRLNIEEANIFFSLDTSKAWQRIFLASLSAVDRGFSQVTVTSGYKIDPITKCTLDWGLIKIPPGRKVANIIPPHPGPLEGWPDLSQGQHYQNIPASDVFRRLKGIADPQEGEEVVKFSRQGLTVGTINGVKDGVRLAGNKRETREWCVVGMKNAAFLKPGDSGSLAVNRDFKVVGLMTASADDSPPFAYLTPIRIVLEDIKLQMGMSLDFWDVY
ncbi:hypothetical protein Dda_8835 [Drechslerella dactyloides]|uniref:Uncharacterized protein n=1 Tax=Drechslerella dactyloides TaxID=74499 RepID=A0AAD6IQ95_DREDA|nr:hypothetical protein Dda_8835 [Drechslerella dactyloides]